MKTDEAIEQERAWLEPFIGPTRAGWYAEACKKEYDAPTEELVWACRVRELCMELGKVVEAILLAKHDGHVFGTRPCETCAKITQAILEPYGCDLYRQRVGLIRKDS